ncbi:hypothetical protein AB0N05_34860 [Nocardia sp. NPDC051030]|uniref:hypothetical protein n=1 Tax=Nocardia sp. NPDC051030 TaxID=3155162 RepID=UPI00343856CC
MSTPPRQVDIARRSGRSVATVRRWRSDPESVSPETRAALEAAEQATDTDTEPPALNLPKFLTDAVKAGIITAAQRTALLEFTKPTT